MALRLLFLKAFKRLTSCIDPTPNVCDLVCLETISEFRLCTSQVNLYDLRSCTKLRAVLKTTAYSNPSILQTVWFHVSFAAAKHLACPTTENCNLNKYVSHNLELQQEHTFLGLFLVESQFWELLTRRKFGTRDTHEYKVKSYWLLRLVGRPVTGGSSSYWWA
jgi:hypothetical protein